MSTPSLARLGPLAAVAVVALAVVAWWSSLMPGSYAATDMGLPDDGRGSSAHAGHGGGPGTHAGHGAGAATVSVTDLAGDHTSVPDVRLRLVAREGRTALSGGTAFAGFTLNGTSPGPQVTATVGQLVEVVLVNEDVRGGATLHWHGLDVPNAEDGVAGVTQDAVRPGEEHVYRWRATQAGTFWYHSHQVSHEQVLGGLLGAVVIRPRVVDPRVADVTALVHVYGGVRTIGGRAGESRTPLAPGATARVRVVNTDNGPVPVWVTSASYRVAAVDGTEVSGPTPVSGNAVTLTAGGRVDLLLTAPADGTAVRVQTPGASLVLGRPGASAPVATRAPATRVDLLSYGRPRPLGFDPDRATRRFDYVIGRRFGLVDGRPGLYWSVNGSLFPDTPMYMVAEGDVVRMRIVNDSGEVHPMHLHGHHVVVLARDGVGATGSPWVVDSLGVEDGATYEVAFVADNPGIWMDHCHNLTHAVEGLTAHLMYEGVGTPFRLGEESRNHPE